MTPQFLPYLLPYLGESGWFSVGLGARKPLNTNDFGMWLLRGGGSENRKVGGSSPPLATRPSRQAPYASCVQCPSEITSSEPSTTLMAVCSSMA